MELYKKDSETRKVEGWGKRLLIIIKNTKTTVKTWITQVTNEKTKEIIKKQTTVMGVVNS